MGKYRHLGHNSNINRYYLKVQTNLRVEKALTWRLWTHPQPVCPSTSPPALGVYACVCACVHVCMCGCVCVCVYVT